MEAEPQAAPEGGEPLTAPEGGDANDGAAAALLMPGEVTKECAEDACRRLAVERARTNPVPTVGLRVVGGDSSGERSEKEDDDVDGGICGVEDCPLKRASMGATVGSCGGATVVVVNAAAPLPLRGRLTPTLLPSPHTAAGAPGATPNVPPPAQGSGGTSSDAGDTKHTVEVPDGTASDGT